MRRALFLTVLLAASSAPALAQFDLVTGQVKDPNGVPYSGATVRAQLTLLGVNVTGQPVVTNSSQAQCISAGLGNAPCKMPFPGSNSFTLDSQGNIPGGGFNLADNPSVTPAGTQWTFNVTESPGIAPPAGTGPQSFSVSITVNSNPLAIGATLSAAAPALGTPSALAIQNAGTPLGTAQTLNCSTNTTCSLAGGVVSVTSSATSSAAWSSITAGTNSNLGSFLVSGNTWNFSGAASFLVQVGAGAAPTADGAIAANSTTHQLNFGSNGTTLSAAVASTGAAGTGTTCPGGQFVSAIFPTAVPTCSTPAVTQTAVNLAFTNRNLASNVGITANSTTNIDQVTLSALPAACGTNLCRLRVSYSYFIDGGVNALCWINESVAAVNTRGVQGSVPSNNYAWCTDNVIIPATYSSGNTPTITIQINDTGAATACASSASGAPCNSGNNNVSRVSNMQIEVILSN